MLRQDFFGGSVRAFVLYIFKGSKKVFWFLQRFW